MTGRSAVTHVLHIDQRASSADRDGFLERSDTQLGIDRGGEPGSQLDAFPLNHAETRQRERDSVGARAQIHDLVPAPARPTPPCGPSR